MALLKCCSLIFDEKWQESCVQKEDWLKFFNHSLAPQSFRQSDLEKGLYEAGSFWIAWSGSFVKFGF